MSVADNPRSHAQVTPFYQVRTTQGPVYRPQGAVGRRGRLPAGGELGHELLNLDI
jgi:hypothetical protein